MNPNACKLPALLGTASFFVLANLGAALAQTQVAQAQVAQDTDTVPETVLVTGSLIRGTVAVGVPVTNISPSDFAQTGALTTADLFKTFPAANVAPGPVGTNANNNISKQTRVNIRGLDPNDGTRSLMLIDGYRFPPQGEADCTIDPSVIPAIALERIDILVDGASATYGSDAIAGVVNIILKRGYSGAITQLRYQFGNGGATNYQASQLWGRTWDGGDITLSYEWTNDSPVKGNINSKLTLDFTPWGLDNRIPIRSSVPGTISTGAASASTGLTCTNCWAIPKGTGSNFSAGAGGVGPTTAGSASTLNWGAFSALTNGVAANGGSTNVSAGTRNEVNPYLLAWYNAAQQKNSSVMTFDQRLTKDISLFGEGFYANRRAQYINPSNLSPSSGNDLAIAVPTWNPYYPTGGAPSGLRVNYNLSAEKPSITNAAEMSARYLFGLNIALPYDWEGKVYYSETLDSSQSTVNVANANAVSAALGWTIGSSSSPSIFPPIASWSKPASVPYLNLFCDATTYQCNSPKTLNYIDGLRAASSSFWVNEKGVTFDGPLFALPGGDVKMAIGANLTSEYFTFKILDSTSSPSLLTPSLTDSRRKTVWAVFTQVNVPIFGEANAIPGIAKLDLEASWRHDQYSDVGGTSNPKVAFNWTLSQDLGLTVKGSWGTSFRAPSFAEVSGLVKNAIAGWNSSLFQQAASISVNCGTDPTSAMGRLTAPGAGYVGWNGTNAATLGTGGVANTCGTTAVPIGMALLGASGTAITAGLRKYTNTSGQSLRPETSTSWGIGAEFAPEKFLKGLDIQATWYSVKIQNALRNFANPNTNSVNDPTLGFAYIVPTDIAKSLAISNPGDPNIAACSNNNTPTACAPFEAMVASLLADPRNPVNPAILPNVTWINDGATLNAGYFTMRGVDFNVSYDFDLGDIGAFNAGIAGTYYLSQIGANFPGRSDVPQAGLVSDTLFNVNLANLFGVAQNGVESLPRLHYRARLGWANGPWTVTGFMDYQSHFFHTQNAPPNVNNQCLATNGTVGGGTLPCLINGYSNIEPSWYTFDLSFGYNTGDIPANDYLKNVSIQIIVQNIMDKHPPFEYRIGTGGGNPCACDILKSLQGRMISIALTKTW